jgi:hypothetical protein
MTHTDRERQIEMHGPRWSGLMADIGSAGNHPTDGVHVHLPTGQRGGRWGKRSSRLSRGTIYPLVGESVEFPADSGGSKSTLLYSSAHSRMKRTRVGVMR